MTLTGHIVGGQIILDAPAALPDGMTVRVELLTPPRPEPTADDESESPVPLRERLKDFLSHAPLDLPPDAAESHDRYLYGSPWHFAKPSPSGQPPAIAGEKSDDCRLKPVAQSMLEPSRSAWA